MATTLIAGAAGILILAAVALTFTMRRGRGTRSLLSLGSVSPQWLQSHRQQEEL